VEGGTVADSIRITQVLLQEHSRMTGRAVVLVFLVLGALLVLSGEAVAVSEEVGVDTLGANTVLVAPVQTVVFENGHTLSYGHIGGHHHESFMASGAVVGVEFVSLAVPGSVPDTVSVVEIIPGGASINSVQVVMFFALNAVIGELGGSLTVL
jgi:hypothetical protein